MTETNLCPFRSEMWECSTNKGTAAVPPAVVAPSAPRRCAAPPLLNNGLGIPNSSSQRVILPMSGPTSGAE
jgi:hypothetical protein